MHISFKPFLSAFFFGLTIGVAATVILFLFFLPQSQTGKKQPIVTIPNGFKQQLLESYEKYKTFQKSEISIAEKEIATAGAIIKIPVVMYHYIEYVKDKGDTIRRGLNIQPHVFEGHLQSLQKHNYETYFVKDIPDILGGKIAYSTHSAILTFDDGYEDFYTDAFPLLKKYNIKSTIYVVNNFIGRKGFMNADQLRVLFQSGLVEVGAHTLDHWYLKNIASQSARLQIFESKKRLEELLGIDIKTFAYPYGAFQTETVDLVKEASFSAAVSVIPGTMQSQDNLFYLSRVRAGSFNINNMVEVLEGINK